MITANVDNWQEPETIDDASQRRFEALDTIASIQAQLGDRSRVESYDNTADYETWRRQAKGALAFHSDELRRLKVWMNQAIATRNNPDKNDPLVAVGQVVRAMKRLVALYAAVDVFLTEDSPESLAAVVEKHAAASEVMG